MMKGARRGAGAKPPTVTASIDARLLRQLREHVAAREIERGIACLQSHEKAIAGLDPSQANAARLLESNPALQNLRLIQSISSAGNTLVMGVPAGFVPLKPGKQAAESSGPKAEE